MSNTSEGVGTSRRRVVYTDTTTTSPGGSVEVHAVDLAPRPDKAIENAVYAHIRAVRALGRTRVNTAEIANALRINEARVREAIQRLQSKGVKVVK